VIIQLPYNWRPRNYQMPAWCYMEGEEEGKRAALVWHRRAGKDLWAINLCAVKSQQRIGTYWHVLPTYKQGRKIVWDGFTRDGRRFRSHFPQELVTSENSSEMKITLANGSIYQVVGTDDVDSLVGTNPIGVVFSEYSLHDPAVWDYIRPILAENGGWAVFIFTMRGKNHGWRLLNMAKENPIWFAQVLVAGDAGTKREDGSPVISDAIIDDERKAGMSEEMIQQEFYCSAEAPLVGSYYGKQMAAAMTENRVREVPWTAELPVHTAWDLGVGDCTSIWFFQQVGMEVRLIDFYEASGEGLAHYVKILKEKPYVYGRHLAPHDIEVRELGTGKSRRETARTLGVQFRTVGMHEVDDGIDQVRNLLSRCWFDEKKCDRGLEALKSYRKEYDEKRKTFKTTPEHDWSSHAADAFRILAMGIRFERRGERRVETAIDEHDYLRA
jgi:phage terminase large subunit